jgi:hypothetical protein
VERDVPQFAIGITSPTLLRFWVTHAGAELDLLLFKDNRRIGIVNHGYETPKQALETNSKARCGVLHPPLCGIVRLTNFNSLRF